MWRICINKCSGGWHVYRNCWGHPDGHRILASGPMAQVWLILLCLLWVSVIPGLAEVYRWTDEAGRVHFTDNPDTIPPERRGHSRQLSPPTTTPEGTTDVPAGPRVPTTPTVTTGSPQPAAPEDVSLLQRQARALEEQIAAALQARQKYLDQLKAVREVRASPDFGRQRRQIDELGRSLAAVERQLDTLYAELRQVQAKLQETGQATQPPPTGKRPPGEAVLDNQGHDRTYWRQRLEALQTRLRQAQEQRQATLAQLGSEEERRAFGRRGVEVLRNTRTLEQLNQEIRDTEAALEALRQDATRASAPVEWLQ